jgi:stage II sporulation protein AB (anti-sigma F factor)
MNKKKPLNEFKMEMASNSINEGFARRCFAAFASQLDPTCSELADIKTAVSEAVTNCIVHAYKEKAGTVYISGKYYADRTFVIKVRDKGCGIENIKEAMKPLFTSDTTGERGGMGFAIMQSFMDKIRVTSVLGKGTTVTMTKKFKSDAKEG